MKSEMHEVKAALRQKVHATLKQLTPEKRAAGSAAVCALLKQQPFWQKAAGVLFFAPMPDEVNVWPLMEESLAGGKVAALPRYDPGANDYFACRVQHPQHEIVAGHFGIREPNRACPELSLERLGLILVPGVAFTTAGARLGRGRGFYDRLLAETHTLKCGVAFDEQIVETIPAANLDVHMDFILTPTCCVTCEQ